MNNYLERFSGGEPLRASLSVEQSKGREWLDWLLQFRYVATMEVLHALVETLRDPERIHWWDSDDLARLGKAVGETEYNTPAVLGTIWKNRLEAVESG